MRLVLANFSMGYAGGSETYLLTIAEQLLSLGHEPLIYANEGGPFCEYVGERGVEVVLDEAGLPESCDVVIAQDAPVSYLLASRYPDAFHIFRACSDIYDFELPPQLDGVVDQVIVLSDRVQMTVGACAHRPPLLRLRQPINLKRLTPLRAIGKRPKKAILLGNYEVEERKRMLEQAWGPSGVEILRVGGPQGQRFDVAQALAEADIVVAKGRAALDGMACGRAVYVSDCFGTDGWVTPESYPSLEADNFAGLASSKIATQELFESELGGYGQSMGAINRDLAVEHHSAKAHVVSILKTIATRAPARARRGHPFFKTTHHSPKPTKTQLRELARLSALNWSWEREATALKSQLGALRASLDRSEEELAETREQPTSAR